MLARRILLALSLVGCTPIEPAQARRGGEAAPRAVSRPPSRLPPRPAPPSEYAEECTTSIAEPIGLDLSDAGREAVEVLLGTDVFGHWAQGGNSRSPSEGVVAYRVLIRERNGTAALHFLIAHACPPGRLFGLTGLHDADPDAFAQARPHFEAQRTAVRFGTNGCTIDHVPMAEIVRAPGGTSYDIVGGRLPEALREPLRYRASPPRGFHLDVTCESTIVTERWTVGGDPPRLRHERNGTVISDHTVTGEDTDALGSLLASKSFAWFLAEPVASGSPPPTIENCTLSLDSPTLTGRKRWRHDEARSPMSRYAERKLHAVLDQITPR